jgi:hypothetical protein
MFVMCENTDITWYYVLPVDCHIVVSLWCSVLVIKSQCMQQLMYNYSMPYASKFAALEVELLALWTIENLWLYMSRQEMHFVTTRSLILAWVSAEATTSIQTCWSQQNMSVVPVICQNQKCQIVQGDGPNLERNFVVIAVVISDLRMEGDYIQEGNGVRIRRGLCR